MSYVPREDEIVEGDLCDMESLEQLFKVPVDSEVIVLHIASIVTVNPEYNQKVMDVNVGEQKMLLPFAKNIKLIIMYILSTYTLYISHKVLHMSQLRLNVQNSSIPKIDGTCQMRF